MFRPSCLVLSSIVSLALPKQSLLHPRRGSRPYTASEAGISAVMRRVLSVLSCLVLSCMVLHIPSIRRIRGGDLCGRCCMSCFVRLVLSCLVSLVLFSTVLHVRNIRCIDRSRSPQIKQGSVFFTPGTCLLMYPGYQSMFPHVTYNMCFVVAFKPCAVHSSKHGWFLFLFTFSLLS